MERDSQTRRNRKPRAILREAIGPGICYGHRMAKPARVPCPICKKENEFFAEPLGPFCSARCKMIDLGKWFGEDYRIREPLRADHFAEYEDLPEGKLDTTEET